MPFADFSPNDSIRSSQHIRWNGKTDLLGGFEVDDELKLGWPLHERSASFVFPGILSLS